MDNWYECIPLYYKYCKINDKTIVISDIYAAKKRKLSDIDILLAQQF